MNATCTPTAAADCNGLCGCGLCAWAGRQCSWCRRGQRPPSYDASTATDDNNAAIETVALRLWP